MSVIFLEKFDAAEAPQRAFRVFRRRRRRAIALFPCALTCLLCPVTDYQIDGPMVRCVDRTVGGGELGNVIGNFVGVPVLT